MKLNDLFTRCVITAEPSDPLSSIACKMEKHNVGAVVIVENRRPVGIVTDRDLALALGARGISPQAEAQSLMTRHVVAIPEEMSILDATRFMRECGVRRLPIVDRHDQVSGIATLDDLLRCLGQELANLTEGIEEEMAVAQ